MRFSPNNIARSRTIIEDRMKKHDRVLNDFMGPTYRANSCLGDSRLLTFQENVRQKGRDFTLYKISTEITKSNSIGNCGEMSQVAFFKALEIGLWNTRVDLVSIEPGGAHVLVVIGRKAESNPRDYTTWGPSAVVIDSWAGKVFKLSEAERNLYDYLRVNPRTGEPQTKLFDPKKQKLKILLKNVCEVEEIKSFMKNLWMNEERRQFRDNFIHHLEEFHQTETLETKIIKANLLYELCNEPWVSDFNIIKLLKEQLAHFLELNTR